MPEHNKLGFWSHIVHAAENAASNSRWFLFIIRTNTLLHKVHNNRKRESGNPTGEPFTAAAHTANRLVTLPLLTGQPKSRDRNAAMSDPLRCRSDGQHSASVPGHGRESSQHAALLLLQRSFLSSRLLTALLTLAVLINGRQVS